MKKLPWAAFRRFTQWADQKLTLAQILDMIMLMFLGFHILHNEVQFLVFQIGDLYYATTQLYQLLSNDGIELVHS